MSDRSMALVPRSVQEAEAMASTFSKAAMVPDVYRNKPADVFLAITYGMEIGIPPAAALRAVAVIKGKPTLYADAMVGLVLGSGKAEFFECLESDGTKATYHTKRKGGTRTVSKSFSIEDAKTAGLLSNGTYKSYPRQMLEARAKAHLARDVYPDLLHGIYSAEEVSEFDGPTAVPLKPEPVVVLDAEYVDAPAPEFNPGEFLERMDSANPLDELNAIRLELQQLNLDQSTEAYAALSKKVAARKSEIIRGAGMETAR